MASSEYMYRFTAVRGLERRKFYGGLWESVTGQILEQMTADELRKCADVMDAKEQS